MHRLPAHRSFSRITSVSLALVLLTSAFPMTVTALPGAARPAQTSHSASADDLRLRPGAARVDYSAAYARPGDDLPDDLRLLPGAHRVNPVAEIAQRRAAEAAAAAKAKAEAEAAAKAKAEAAAKSKAEAAAKAKAQAAAAAKAKAEAAAKAAAKPAPAATPKPTASKYSGRNRFWYPALGISQSVAWFPCSRSREPDNLVYRWGCAGSNNVYLMAHAWGKFNALNRAYYNGSLKAGQLVVYGDAKGRIHYYRLDWSKTARPTTSASWAWAAQSRSSLTLQTCVGANSELRLFVRFHEVAKP
jgi:hypothetical protein